MILAKKLIFFICKLFSDPFLFSGTVRENLDPLSRCSDAELWDALRKSNLAPVIDRLGGDYKNLYVVHTFKYLHLARGIKKPFLKLRIQFFFPNLQTNQFVFDKEKL